MTFIVYVRNPPVNSLMYICTKGTGIPDIYNVLINTYFKILYAIILFMIFFVFVFFVIVNPRFFCKVRVSQTLVSV